MNRLFVFGSISMMAGLLLLVMKTLARMMPGDPTRFDYTLKTMLGPDRLAWVDTISISGLQSAASWMAGAPLFLLFFIVGLLLIFGSGFKKD
ncbi:hypothetical protein DSLASN_29880 [Desulfoluna limicola]|uniref:Uncharacterized protein n=1 Tax=Desulfoluna limicola TaxID=2810562 RepID=A0ABM7PIE3_9BACT|nr:hypothetical protein [Desulfoluna limicola]BCS97356.1 hypothetical protein DSLASN_29880 [Desulfoluna limicola]